jgi:hypothetical protein
MSATHSRFGLSAVKLRSTRSINRSTKVDSFSGSQCIIGTQISDILDKA